MMIMMMISSGVAVSCDVTAAAADNDDVWCDL